MAIQENNGCPDRDQMMAFVGRTLSPEEAGAVALHVSQCERCRCAMRELVLSRAREKVWDMLREAFSPGREYLAAADGQTADQSQHDTAAKSGFIHFIANLDRDDADFWHVKLSLPTVVTEESRVRMQVLDKDDHRIERGVLTFLGADLPVVGGRASMSVTELQACFRNPANSMISFSREAGRVVNGVPFLAYDMQR